MEPLVEDRAPEKLNGRIAGEQLVVH